MTDATNEYGEEWRIEIGDSATPTVFLPIAGETGFDFKRSASSIDDSDKDGGKYGSGSFGQQTLTMSVKGNLKLPDLGFTRASTVSKTMPPHTPAKVMKGNIVKYSGSVAVGPISTTHNNNATVDYSFDMVNRGQPLVDDLGATA
ncbi:hypothetical protein [Sphingomonas echinoides]|uniref:Phage tail protein n=1 Tax=Sphingomonas echinoides TaxID=59803 RepID=A0ABU4PKK1_9SPHN|nr:hypothetical protein [Sphingomonas echinoides]MDX5984696.1 hypothetical protein [Sphingomonas echinoides]